MLILMSMFVSAAAMSLTSSIITPNSDGTISATLTLKADSASLSPRIIEIQPRAGKCSSLYLSFMSFVSGQKVCDAGHPQNVHRVVTLNPNEQVTITLVTPKMPSGNYCIVGVSADSCCNANPNCVALTPFNWGMKLKDVTLTSGVVQGCGDHACTGSETYGTCPADCTSFCGDTFCAAAKGEDKTWCGDCGWIETKCGDGVCDPANGESAISCFKDCPAPIPPPCTGASCDITPKTQGAGGITSTQIALIIAGLAVLGGGIWYLRK